VAKGGASEAVLKAKPIGRKTGTEKKKGIECEVKKQNKRKIKTFSTRVTSGHREWLPFVGEGGWRLAARKKGGQQTLTKKRDCQKWGGYVWCGGAGRKGRGRPGDKSPALAPKGAKVKKKKESSIIKKDADKDQDMTRTREGCYSNFLKGPETGNSR